jgi:hypothetical protein
MSLSSRCSPEAVSHPTPPSSAPDVPRETPEHVLACMLDESMDESPLAVY